MTASSLPDPPPSSRAYQEALAFWYGCINYEQRQPCPEDLKLEEIQRLLRALSRPQDRLRIVHVAGSKGKGSVSAMLANILQRAGFRTGLFTSPHLMSPLERIQVDSVPITPEELTGAMAEIQAATRSAGLQPTFFETATALGFLHFQHRRVDVAVVEVGLGGRLDSTNVCLPEVAIVTSISLDHTQQLGTTLASIATEKAGILKPERPAVSGVVDPEVRAVIENVAQERRSPLRQLGIDFHYQYASAQLSKSAPPDSALNKSRVQVSTWRESWPWLRVNLMGEHQAANAAVAVAAVEILRERGWRLSDDAVATGLETVYWPGRLEVMDNAPWVILDCAHNTASAQALVTTLGEVFGPRRRLLVFASSNDKDVPGIMELLVPHFDHACLTQYGDNPRAVKPQLLGRYWEEQGGPAHSCHAKAGDALARARELAGRNDLICITGSVFLAGELRPLLVSSQAQQSWAN
jgi:dihydrofolate synthase / folylpolyglutamate synthase